MSALLKSSRIRTGVSVFLLVSYPHISQPFWCMTRSECVLLQGVTLYILYLHTYTFYVLNLKLFPHTTLIHSFPMWPGLHKSHAITSILQNHQHSGVSMLFGKTFLWPPFGSKHIFLTQVLTLQWGFPASCGMMSAVLTRQACRGGGAAASRDLSELVVRLQRCNHTADPTSNPSQPSTFRSWMWTPLCGKVWSGRTEKGSFPNVQSYQTSTGVKPRTE